MTNGWISIHRQLLDHWLWEENREFSKAEAWIDILLNVNHTPKDVVIKSKVYKVNRGESIMSLDSWGKRWKWNKSKVRRFLNLLQEQSMIELKNETQTTRLTVCKYDNYQVQRNANETQTKRKRNANETQMTPNNNDNKENNILERKRSFQDKLQEIYQEDKTKYPKELYRDFYSYWSEHGENDKKMRYEKQTSFNIKRRLSTWYKNDFNGTYTKKKEVEMVDPKDYFKSYFEGKE